MTSSRAGTSSSTPTTGTWAASTAPSTGPTCFRDVSARRSPRSSCPRRSSRSERAARSTSGCSTTPSARPPRRSEPASGGTPSTWRAMPEARLGWPTSVAPVAATSNAARSPPTVPTSSRDRVRASSGPTAATTRPGTGSCTSCRSVSSHVGPESGRDDLFADSRAGRITGHGGQVRVALQDAHTHVGVRGCTNGGRPRLVAQERDLAEAVAAFERLDDASVDDHLGLPRLDDVEALAGLALLEHHLPRLEVGMLERGTELFDRRRRERTQHEHSTQDLDVRVPDAHPRIEPTQRGPAGGHGQRRDQADRDEGEANAEQRDDQRRGQA